MEKLLSAIIKIPEIKIFKFPITGKVKRSYRVCVS